MNLRHILVGRVAEGTTIQTTFPVIKQSVMVIEVVDGVGTIGGGHAGG